MLEAVHKGVSGRLQAPRIAREPHSTPRPKVPPLSEVRLPCKLGRLGPRVPRDPPGEFTLGADPGLTRPGLTRPGLTRPGLTRPGEFTLGAEFRKRSPDVPQTSRSGSGSNSTRRNLLVSTREPLVGPDGLKRTCENPERPPYKAAYQKFHWKIGRSAAPGPMPSATGTPLCRSGRTPQLGGAELAHSTNPPLHSAAAGAARRVARHSGGARRSRPAHGWLTEVSGTPGRRIRPLRSQS